MTSRALIFHEIDREREHQDKKWGHDFDDKNTVNDWTAYIARYSSNASFTNYGECQREALLKTAALAVAAIEAFDRNDGFPLRHYQNGEV